MKITKERLTRIIKEELEAALEEGIMDRFPKFKFGTDPDKPFASYNPGTPEQKPLTNAEYSAMRRQKKADHDARSQKIGREKEEARAARKAQRRKEMGIKKEEIGDALETSEDQDHQHLLSDPDVGGRRGLKLLIRLKKLIPTGGADASLRRGFGPAELYDFLSDASDGDHGLELNDLLYDIYSNTHLSIEDVVDYWSSI